MLTESNDGTVKNAINLLVGPTKEVKTKMKKFGLKNGLLRAIPSDKFLSKAAIAKQESDELLTIGYPVIRNQIELILRNASI